MASYKLWQHRRRLTLVEAAETAYREGNPEWERINEEIQKLPEFIGRLVTPKGEEISVGLYVRTNEVTKDVEVEVSVRPWVSKDEPIKKG